MKTLTSRLKEGNRRRKRVRRVGKKSRNTPFLLSGVPQNHQVYSHSIYAEDPAETHAGSAIAVFVSVSLLDPCSVDSGG